MPRLQGTIQHYRWGDPTFIPELLGIEPDGRPWAELWLGTHHTAPSQLDDGRRLSELTGELPYLLKVLAAAEPLSLQTHPNAAQARDGFARGVYADDQPKPELLLALTAFEAFCGVRPVTPTLDLLDGLGIDELARVLVADGPGAALAGLYRGTIDPRPAITACDDSDRPEAVWVRKLAQRYPDDPSVAATLLLNHVVLAPGQALHLDAGTLHSYLCGAGIELMGPSDNVVRGGLTEKPVDVDLLLEIVDATPLEQPVLDVDDRYELPGAGVALVRLDTGRRHVAECHELAIDLDGEAWYYAPGEHVVAATTTYVVTPI